MKQRSAKTLVACIDDVLRLRPKLVTHHVFLGTVTEPTVTTFLATLTQGQRDDLLHRAVTAIAGSTGKVGSRLGVEQFTLVSPTDLSQALGLSADLLERRINEKLAELCPHANNH